MNREGIRAFVKPAVTGVLAGGADYGLFNRSLSNPQEAMMNSAYFAAAVAGGIAAAEMVGPTVTSFVQLGSAFSNGKTLEERGFEIIGASAAAYALNSVVFKNDRFGDLMPRIGIIVGADIIGEYITDLMLLEKPSYF